MTTSRVAQFINARIEEINLLQKDIAEKVGFEKPNMITMIKQGRTRLPLDKVGPIASALEIDPLALLKMCFEEYYPATWHSIAPLLEGAFSQDERRIINAMRSSAGGSFLASMTDNSKRLLDEYLDSVRTQHEPGLNQAGSDCI